MTFTPTRNSANYSERGYLGTCVHPGCRRAVYRHQAHTRITRPATGIAHAECAETAKTGNEE